VLCIGHNRLEKLNAMDIELYLELAEAYGVLDTDKSLRCGLLYGEGFCKSDQPNSCYWPIAAWTEQQLSVC